MRSSRLVTYALALIAVGSIIAGIFYFINNRPISVWVAVPERNVALQVFGLGSVEARVISNAGFEVAGTLDVLKVDHGDNVKRGDVLALLDASEQQARVVRAEAGVQSSEASLNRTQTQVERQAAMLAQKEETNRRQQELLRKGVAAVEKAQDAAKDQKVAEADLAIAKADAAVALAAVATARADLLREQVLLRKYSLQAAFDATVITRRGEPGAAVKAGDPVYTLADPSSVWALAHVEEARSGEISVGQKAEVRLRSRPGKVFAARVVRIGIESDRVSEERRVWVKCEVCPPAFHLGEQAEVIITTGILAEALLVPEIMVSGFNGHSGSVWVADKGVARRASVTLGQRTLDGRIAVLDGLPGGAEIIVARSQGLREGRAVSITPGAEP
jgi:HlyD family secretion protein